MGTEAPPGGKADLDGLLSDYIGREPHLRGAVLLSADGLKTAFAGFGGEDAESRAVDADYLAVVACSLYSAGKSAGRFGGEVRQVVVELDTAVLFIAAAGPGARLAVLAGQEADLGLVGHGLAHLVTSVRPFLAIPARHPAAGAPQGPAGQG